MIKKLLAITIFFLFIGISITPSTGKNIKSVSTEGIDLEYSENSISGCIPVYKAYGYVAYNPSGEEGLYGFDLYPFGNFTFIGPGGSGDFLNGACFVPPCYIYFLEYGSEIVWVLNILTLDFYAIGGGGSSLYGLDYDDESGFLYAAGSYGLYKIDLESGEQTYIGSWGSGYIMITIAINNGICYGLDLVTDSIYIIDLDTAELTLLGPTGLNLNYAQDMGFDKDNNILYLAAYITTGQLYIVNLTNGDCTLVGNFPGGSEVSAFAIIYGNIPPYVPCDIYPEDGAMDIPLNVTICWTGGDYNPEDNVTYDVYFGTAYPPTIVSNNQTEICYKPDDLNLCQVYYFQIVAWDNHGLFTPSPIWSFTTTCENLPPTAPNISGPIHGKVGVEYNWTFVSIDPDGDDVYYLVQWGGGCGSQDWVGPYPSGEEITLNHTYRREGTFTIYAQAVDIHGAESDWSTFEGTMPREKMLHYSLFLNFLDRYPFIQDLLDILGRNIK